MAVNPLTGPVKFDFGSAVSPVMAGYVQATSAPYAAAAGFGWNTPNIWAGDWWQGGTALTRDYNYGRDATFQVDLPNGVYQVSPTLGNLTLAHYAVNIDVNGKNVATHLSTDAGQTLRPSYTVQVTDGRLSVRLFSTQAMNVTGRSPYFALDALDVTPYQPTATPSAPVSGPEGEGVTGSVVIDGTWLSARGSGPYLLDQANTNYLLACDVTTQGTAFVVTAPNVVFDLNGHTVTYGDATPVVLGNGGFEQGTGRNVPGWNVTGAPAAALAPNTNYLFGNQVLRLSNFSTPQSVLSDPIPVAKANRTYVATVTPAHTDYNTKLTLSVVDAVTGLVLASTDSRGAGNGFAPVVRFTPTSNAPVRLRIDVTPASGVTTSIDLDAAEVTAADDYGVLGARLWSGELPGFANLTPAVQTAYSQNWSKVANVTVKNGSIRQGQGNGYASSPLYLKQTNSLTVDGVQTYATGTDTESLIADRATGVVTVRNSIFRENIANITVRTANVATVSVTQTNGTVLIEGNQMIGSPQIGVMASDNNPAYTFTIRNNLIQQNAVVTNSYAIAIAALGNFEVSGNTIIPVSGRGITIDGYSATAIQGGSVHDNYVSVQERPEREYGATSPARALRIRNNVDKMGAVRNLIIYNNTFIATTGPGLVTSAYGVRIDLVNNNGTMNDANIMVANNVIKGITTSADRSYRSSALVVDGVAAGIRPSFVGNTLESNDTSLAINGSDGWDIGVNDVTMVSNTLVKSAAGAAVPYVGIRAGYWVATMNNVQLIDTRVANGATTDVAWSGSGLKNLSFGSLLDVAVVDGSGAPVAGATVTVKDGKMVTTFTGVTDAKGLVKGVAVVSVTYAQLTADPRVIVTTKKLPVTVTATSGVKVGRLLGDPATNGAVTVTVA